MKTLIYKRTHTGDPGADGVFGFHGCMGRVRDFEFDAVIGIGGCGHEPELCEIDRRINWIGVGPHKCEWYDGGPMLTFDHFVLFDSDGDMLETLAPVLANRFYTSPAPRFVLDDFNAVERLEIAAILRKASRSPASKGGSGKQQRKCHPKGCPDC